MSFQHAGDHTIPCNCGPYGSILPPPPCPMHGNPAKFTFGTMPAAPTYQDCTTPAPTVGDLERRIVELERRLAEHGK